MRAETHLFILLFDDYTQQSNAQLNSIQVNGELRVRRTQAGQRLVHDDDEQRDEQDEQQDTHGRM